jgi:hypothetical protein
MIGMTSQAVLGFEALVKGDFPRFSRNDRPFGGFEANRRDSVTTDAPTGDRPLKRRMTSRAIPSQALMGAH